jgi:TPR repeat protein
MGVPFFLPFYLIAADQGDSEGMFNAGRYYLLGIGTEQHNENAMNWLGHAAHLDHKLACYWMGGIYLDAQYVVPDPAMASNFYERGATLGDSYCQNKHGIMYRDGVGRAVNLEQARALFLLSTDSGNEWWQFLLGQMYLTGTHVNQDLDRARQLFTLSAEQGLAEAQVELGAVYGKGLGSL